MENKHATGVQKIQKVQLQNQKNVFLAVLVPGRLKVVLNARRVTLVKRVLVSMVLVNCVQRVNTVQVELMELKQLQQLVSVVQLGMYPVKAVPNVNRVVLAPMVMGVKVVQWGTRENQMTTRAKFGS
jgi:hypothetical protein